MAAHIESKDIKAFPVLPYPDLRAKLKSGDILFTSGDYLVSKAIQKVTDSPWSHVGIVLRLDSIDRMLLLESVEDMGCVLLLCRNTSMTMKMANPTRDERFLRGVKMSHLQLLQASPPLASTN